MGVQVFCPKCDRACRIREEHLGKRVRCPACREIFKAEEVPTAELDEQSPVGDSLPNHSSNKPILPATEFATAAEHPTVDLGTGDDASIAARKKTRTNGENPAGTREKRQRTSGQRAPETEFAWDDAVIPPEELPSKSELPALHKGVEPPKPKREDDRSPFAFDDEQSKSIEQREVKKSEAADREQTKVPSAPTPKKKIEPPLAANTDPEPNGKPAAAVAIKKETSAPAKAVDVPSRLPEARPKSPAKAIPIQTPDPSKADECDPFAFGEASLSPDETIDDKKRAVDRAKVAQSPVGERRAKPRDLPRKNAVEPPPVPNDESSPFTFFDDGSAKNAAKSSPSLRNGSAKEPVAKPNGGVDTRGNDFFVADERDSSAPKNEVRQPQKKSSRRACFHVRQSGFWGDARLFRVFVQGEELVFVTAASGKDIGEMEKALQAKSLDEIEKRIRNKVLDLDELPIDELTENDRGSFRWAAEKITDAAIDVPSLGSKLLGAFRSRSAVLNVVHKSKGPMAFDFPSNDDVDDAIDLLLDLLGKAVAVNVRWDKSAKRFVRK